MPVPTWGAAGSFATYTTTSPIQIPHPSGIQSGQLLIMQTNGAGSPSTPSGWSKIHDSAWNSSYEGRRHCVFTKIASGSESGNQAVVFASGAYTGHMYRIIDVKQSGTWYESLVSRTGTPSSAISIPDIPVTGPRLAIVIAARGGDGNAFGDNWTDETGGTWVLRASGTTGTGTNYGLGIFTAYIESGTISGGTASSTSAAFNSGWSALGLALIGQPSGGSQSMVIS